MATVEELVLQLSAKTDNVVAELNKVNALLAKTGETSEKATKKATDGFKDFEDVVKKIVTAAAVQKFISHIVEVEQSGIRLQAVLRATGRDAGNFTKEMSNLAQQMEDTTLFDGEDIKNAIAQLATFKNISNDTFNSAIKLGADLAAAYNRDVVSSIVLVGKAFESPAEAVGRLERIVGDFTPVQKEAIQAMVDAGKVAEAQAEIQEILKGKVQGTAEAMKDGLAGAIHDAKNALDDLMESIADSGGSDVLQRVFKQIESDIRLIIIAIYGWRKAWAELKGDSESLKEINASIAEQAEKFKAAQNAVWDFSEKTKALTQSQYEAKAGTLGFKTEIEGLNNALPSYSGGLKGAKGDTDKLNESTEKLASTLEEKMLDNALELHKMGLDPLGKKLADIDDIVGRNAAAFKNMGQEGKELVKTLKMQTKELHELEEAQKQAAKEAEEMQKSFDHAFENIQDALADMILQGDFSFKSLVQIAKKSAAEIASAMIIKPVIGGAMQSVLGMGGSGGGMPSLPSLSNISSLFSGGGSFNQPIFSSGSFIGGGIDSIGNALGIGSSNFIGPMPAGQLAPLSSMFTPAAGLASFGGSLAANLLGVKQGVGTSIGGTIGGIAGTAFGGPIGGFIGSAAGSLIGSAFGPSAPKPASEFSANFGMGGNILSSNVASKHIDKAAGQAALDSVSAIAAQLGAIGFDLSGVGVRGGNAKVRGGNYFEVAGQSQISFGNEAADADRALKDLIMQLTEVATITNDDVNTALKNLQTEGKTSADILNELAYAAAKPALKEALEKQLNIDIMKITDPVGARVKEVNDEFDALLTRATELGADVTLVEKLRQLTLSQIDGVNDSAKEAAKAMDDAAKEAGRLAEKFAAVADQLADTLNELFFGENSIYSPMEQYNAAKSQFETVAGKAQGGDLMAMEQLSDAFKTFIAESRAVNSSGATYAADFNYGTGILQNAMNLAASQAMAYGVQSGVAGTGATDLSGISAAINALAKSQTQTNLIIKSMAVDSMGRRVA